MTDSDMIARMLKLLPHWAEHTDEHVTEIRRWRVEAETVLEAQTLACLEHAEHCMQDACTALEEACRALQCQTALTSQAAEHQEMRD